MCSVSPLFRSVCEPGAAPEAAAPEAAAPEAAVEVVDIEVFILDADGTVIDRPDIQCRLATHYMRDHGCCLTPILQGRMFFLEM